MVLWILLQLILTVNFRSLSAAAIDEVNVYPEDLARLKNEGASETTIQSRVERLEHLLFAKRNEAKVFAFVAKVIPAAGLAPLEWKIESNSETVLTFRDSAGYLSTKTRAEVAARQLNRALMIGDGAFDTVQRNGDTAVVFRNPRKEVMITSASEQDESTHGFNIAEQWVTRLNRFWQSLPQVLLHPLPEALKFQDLDRLSKIGLTDQTLLSFLHLRDIDSAVKIEHVKDLKFNKDVAQYLEKRLTSEETRSEYWDYYGSYGYCSSTSIVILGGTIIGGSRGFVSIGHRSGSARSGSKGSAGKSSHAGVRGRSRR